MNWKVFFDKMPEYETVEAIACVTAMAIFTIAMFYGCAILEALA